MFILLGTATAKVPWYDNLLEKFLAAGIAILVGILVILIVKQLIEKLILRKMEPRKRATLSSLLQNASKYIIGFIVIMIILESFGISTASILAVAGVGSVALGFGAQSLVKDVISGFFIIAENQYNIRDIINIDGREGVVEEIGLRTTITRNIVNGEVYIIPNGEIKVVTNLSKGFRRAVIVYTVPFELNLEETLATMEKLVAAYDGGKDVLSQPVVQGVVEYADSGVNIRVVCEAVPEKSWAVERDLRKYLKVNLEAAGITIPYTIRELHMRDEQKSK